LSPNGFGRGGLWCFRFLLASDLEEKSYVFREQILIISKSLERS
jgi:hypothetical protein